MPSEHSSKWGVLGWGNTEIGCVWVLASIWGIAVREKNQVAIEQNSRQDLVGMKQACPDGLCCKEATGQGNSDA